MTTAAPEAPAEPQAGPSTPRPTKKSTFQQNQRKYAYPLPIVLPLPHQKPKPTSYFAAFRSVFSSGPLPVVEICTGEYDPLTRSVWVTDERSKEVLFRRGFFGKGSLSRSEPSWRDRRLDLLRGGDSVAAEKIREARRAARKQFKIDRAAAMLEAAKQAEAVLTSGRTPSTPNVDSGAQETKVDDQLGEDGRAPSPAPSSAAGGAASLDVSSLTPQTFLVRPTRPDANRNQGKKAFRRRPAPAPGNTSSGPLGSAASGRGGAHGGRGGMSRDGGKGSWNPRATQPEEESEESGSEEELLRELVDEKEHLQLCLEEAWFLSAGLGVLRVLDPHTDSYPPVSALLPLFATPPTTSPSIAGSPHHATLLPDDPFLVSYIAYHHFRSIGWVVKPGIKFCCDWLLYRRGPAFSHSAFSCIIVPVYSDPADRESSPYGHEDWYEERTSWKWMNTIMRVNSLVQKTVILVYITIPALSSFPDGVKLANGCLDPVKNDMARLLPRYSVREVSLMRFGPARRRD